MRSMQDNELGNISCCSPCTAVNESISVPSGDVMSSGHRDLDLAFKSPNIIVKDGSSCLTKLRGFSKFDKNSSNSTVV